LVQSIIGNTAGFTGKEYFRNLVEVLSRTLNTDYSFLAVPVQNHPGKAETIALSYRGKSEKNFSYDLRTAPGKGAGSRGPYLFPEDVQTQFPDDQMLKDLGITAYAGIDITDNKGRCLGMLVVMSQSRLSEPEFVKDILQLSAIRTRAELERIKSEKALRIYQDNLRSMASELSTVEDREKRAIAEYLHDYLGQSLALAKIKIGRALRKEPTPEIAGILTDLESDITDAINYSQSVIYELSPPILYELGLLEALKWKMNDFEKKQGIKTEFRIPEREPTLKQDMSIVIFRAVTELLNNVVKHSAASKVKLSVIEEKERLILTLSDNGIGFEDQQRNSEQSRDQKFGLFSIRERMNYHGGRMEIKSPDTGGTVISLFVPLV
jgi:signal transduction histidine kinase